jgi:hypothetical protein
MGKVQLDTKGVVTGWILKKNDVYKLLADYIIKYGIGKLSTHGADPFTESTLPLSEHSWTCLGRTVD